MDKESLGLCYSGQACIGKHWLQAGLGRRSLSQGSQEAPRELRNGLGRSERETDRQGVNLCYKQELQSVGLTLWGRVGVGLVSGSDVFLKTHSLSSLHSCEF